MAAFAVILALGLLATGGYVTAKYRSAATGGPAADDDEIYTGSILYMPEEGRNCHQILFDNKTGLLSDLGEVDCQHPVYGDLDNTPKEWSSARLHVISSGFRDR
jgi:hypothetical protein